MCGIAGIYNFDQDRYVDEDHLWQMGKAIAHRGPDNKGVFAHENVGLSYRRLSILDVAEQEQPILTNEDKTLRISFNGEIYNFPELKEELLAKGHKFYTGTDTEMVLHLYEEEGTACVKKLNGIFAFAILDTRDNSLFVARDQLGIKPLYYHRNEDRFAFASEIKALLELPDVKRRVDREALSHYFRYRFVPDPLTMFDNVYKLPPAHWMRIRKGKVEFHHYWSMRSNMKVQVQKVRSEQNIIQLVRETVGLAIERQLLSDVPLGAFLSGGIDSSIVVGVMSKILKDPVKTFSIGFSEKGFDESNYARGMSNRFKTDHHEIILTPEHVKQLPKIVWHLDEPLADPAAVPTYFLSEMARKDVTVVLTGEGGDELFAGYKEDFNYRLSKWLRFVPGGIRQDLAELVGDTWKLKGKTRLYRSLLADRKRAEHIISDLFRFNEAPVLAQNVVDEANVKREQTYNFAYFWEKTKGMTWLDKMLYLETKIWLPGDPLMKVDKMTMANSLEARVPLLDMEVVELAARIPSYLKNKNGIEKYLLRKAFEDILPKEIYDRRKTAFELPVGSWLKDELSPIVNEYLAEDRLNESEFFDAGRVNQMIRLHKKGKQDFRYEIWSMLVFQIWYERWFE